MHICWAKSKAEAEQHSQSFHFVFDLYWGDTSPAQCTASLSDTFLEKLCREKQKCIHLLPAFLMLIMLRAYLAQSHSMWIKFINQSEMFSECEETPGICSFMITLGSILIGKYTKTEKLWMFSLEILLKENLRIDLKTYSTHCTERELFSNHSTIWWERNLTNRERDPLLKKYLSKSICIGVNFSAGYSSLLPALHHKSCPGN